MLKTIGWAFLFLIFLSLYLGLRFFSGGFFIIFALIFFYFSFIFLKTKVVLLTMDSPIKTISRIVQPGLDDQIITKEENPIQYWAWVIAAFLLGVIMVAMGVCAYLGIILND
jgi:hypothetical protein